MKALPFTLLALCLLPQSSLAQPEWVGASCYDGTRDDGARRQVSRQECADLFPTEFNFLGCTCYVYAPTGSPIEPADLANCGGSPPGDCGQEEGAGSGTPARLSRPEFFGPGSDAE